ncbi:hypothetical protein HMPREF1987_02106 [Peptostreptococcaceae bacterium oral taxon 113 str. W5053]|nr:hypothetical protein HMPREF1987_02106 [Peptostreptococcaceae bacterium oral taxon 113 str. W5053]
MKTIKLVKKHRTGLSPVLKIFDLLHFSFDGICLPFVPCF